MKGLDCPYCNQKCLGFWAKLLLSPRTEARCSSCGGAVGTNTASALLVLSLASLLPLIGIVFALIYSDSNLLAVLAAAVGTGASLLAYYWFVPLVARAA
ncbi:MAG: hypothetical protein ACK8QZ_12855 [Anaerolineales bacterium]